MKVLVVENDRVSREILFNLLQKNGYDTLCAVNGVEGLCIMEEPDRPDIVVLDLMMPEMDGMELCRRIRAVKTDDPPYLIMLTVRSEKENVVAGLAAGANDYVTKPYDREELLTRIAVGKRMIELQKALLAKIADLSKALEHIKLLQGLIPICMYCKKVRDDKNYWEQIEHYIAAHSDAKFTHGICPDCSKRVMNEMKEM